MRTTASPCSMLLCAAVTLLIVPLGLAGCGTTRDGPSGAGAGTPAERAFLAAMVEHHVWGTEMARLAQTRAREPLVLRLATSLIAAHGQEILQMDAIHRRLFGDGVASDPAAPGRLGLTAREAALDDGAGIAALEGVELFDVAFLDRMAAHHRGAIALAEAAMRVAVDPELRRLAETILAARTAQVEEMTDFRASRYGAPTRTRQTDGAAPVLPTGTNGVVR
jgi:uncharacterized protein (DUF305 family)